ncbi:DUF2490 domain-containing protein [Pontibacter oryzae]|uniref:DUF2490 domain-containing protein n=1 Tax=Pontibacter oryzae TaxID=2304593 RepID=A0A399S0J0_9BACT|nr:DUF2490 domain-containing protein [Pontibacter oryzae]RIJ36808.1 DUF2490 domain-containing protein [Pontibacter oryzae]
MSKKILLALIAVCLFLPKAGVAQINEDKLGAWYMYFFNTTFKDSQWGVQGDIQYRNWNVAGDLEQLLIRSGVTYTPRDANVTFTLGYANITTGAYGSSDATTTESRIYQEALVPVKVGSRFYLTNRFRFEQRFVEDQDFRTRYRYNLMLNVPLNKVALEENAVYLALYNEVFINGQQDIGDDRTVEYFDRNRAYAGMGFVIKPGLRVQLGYMNQKTDNWGKNQLQVGLHHKF